MIGNSAARAVLAVAALATVGAARADGPALRLRAAVVGSAAAPLTIEVLRWSTVEEREPLLAALTAPPPAASVAPPAAAGRGGRGGRGGRAGAPPLSPAGRLSAAVRAAPTVGFIWGDGPTGYSIKYAWRDAADAPTRLVVVTDRRLGAHAPGWPRMQGSPADAEFTVVEFRLDASGAWAGKMSSTTSVAADPAVRALTLEGYPDAPVLLKVVQ